ncbi:MAG: helix-turn-helix domain-containing protein [Opitutae bacterium]|nr:helix-turn-helix domain-containing protein [Opitutae bacterium]MBT6850768.1 helix-turn-helix domain-containing protein [Opitutae bacterium]MBT7742793.1 helix-turn-helix domain-containing protein [Opitutae bacterium]
MTDEETIEDPRNDKLVEAVAKTVREELAREREKLSSPWITGSRRAADYMGCSPRTIRKLVREGRLRAYALTEGKGFKTGTQRFAKKDLDAMLIEVR